jgi:hypothetical protein
LAQSPGSLPGWPDVLYIRAAVACKMLALCSEGGVRGLPASTGYWGPLSLLRGARRRRAIGRRLDLSASTMSSRLAVGAESQDHLQLYAARPCHLVAPVPSFQNWSRGQTRPAGSMLLMPVRAVAWTQITRKRKPLLLVSDYRPSASLQQSGCQPVSGGAVCQGPVWISVARLLVAARWAAYAQ